MLSISALTPSLALDSQLSNSPSFGKDKVFIDDPNVDKVSLSAGQPDPDMTYQHLASHHKQKPSASSDTSQQNKDAAEPLKEPDRLAKMMQQVLDAKLGVDRKKLEEIEEKIEALTTKEGELSDAEKAQLDMLQKQKEQLIKDGSKKLIEEKS